MLAFFGLQREPFSIAPDPRYLYLSERHREALAHLLYGVQAGGGFVLLTGEIGAGKTTVCRALLQQLPRHCNVAYIYDPLQSAAELLESICAEFHAERDPALPLASSARGHVAALNGFLLRAHAQGQDNVLIIDEAQKLSAGVLEQLRLLTNLETHERKLLQIILIGQPELRELLARPELEPLAQRVIARYHLDALSGVETLQYVAHRLGVAGLRGASPFDAAALQRIHALSRGVPRRINLLCERALLGAYALGRAHIDAAVVEQAAAEVRGELPRAGRAGWGLPRARAAVAIALGVLAGAALLGLGLLGSDAWHAAGEVAAAAVR